MICIFAFHHKQCASNKKNFTFVKLTTQMFSNTDESLKDEAPVLLFWVRSLVTLRTFVFIHIISVVKPV